MSPWPRPRLISEPERPLADHAAFTKHSLVKRSKHLSSSATLGHQGFWECGLSASRKEEALSKCDQMLELDTSNPWGLNTITVSRTKQDLFLSFILSI